MSFRLYPVELHWCSFADYREIMQTAERLKAKSVLEFGPGSSTLALIEGGAQRIDACEDNEDWAKVYRTRLEGRFPKHVQIQSYRWSDPVFIATVHGRRYDLGLVDGPAEVPKRLAAIAYAMERCEYVLVPMEDDEGCSYRDTVLELALAASRDVELTKTGPLAGSYALMRPAPC